MSFFAMPLAGQALLCSDICSEKRDESNLPPAGIGWLHFIPFFGTMQSLVLKRAYDKKDISLFLTIHLFSVKGRTKKEISFFSEGFLSPITLKRSVGVMC